MEDNEEADVSPQKGKTEPSTGLNLSLLMRLCGTWNDISFALIILFCIVGLGYSDIAPTWRFMDGRDEGLSQVAWAYLLAAVMTMTAFVFELTTVLVEYSPAVLKSLGPGCSGIHCQDNKVMMMVYAMLSLSYFKMALKPTEWVHTDSLAAGGPRPVFTLRYVEWGVCMSLLLALSCDPASERGDDDMILEPPAARERSAFVQQVHMIANIPVVVGNRISSMPLAPSARCTFIYIWSSWLALVVEDEFTRWFLLCASFAAYAVAALEQLVQCYIYWDRDGGGEWGALVLFQVFLAGFYGIIYLGAELNLYSWQTEQLAYTFSDVGAKFLHSSFLMSLHRQRNLLRLSQLRRAAYNVAADLQRMIRQASVPIFTVNMDQKVQDWNLKIEEVTGISRTEAVGHVLSDLASGDELDSWWSAAGDLLQDAMEEHGPNITEMTFNASGCLTYPAGTVMAVSATVLRGGSGEVKGAVCIGQDISAITAEKNRAQAVADGLTRLIEAANTPIFQVDLSDNIVVWNNWLVRTTGLERQAVLGKHISTVLSPGSKKKFQDACKKVLGSCDADLFEINLVNTEDQKRTLLVTATPCVSQSGQINGAICIGQDITRLKDLDERKASMMAMVSHELKSPLHGIIGLCSSLLDDGNAAVEAGQVPRSLEMVYSCATRLLDMVANIMDTSVLVNNKKMRMSRDPVQVKDIIDEVITLCRTASNGRDRGPLLRPGVQLINNIHDALPIIEADAYRCTQLLYNLITNAIKFTHEGSVVVSAGYDDEEQRVFVEIEDTGIGIEKANIDRIFEPFDQEDTSESRQYSGLGLGLSISREVVRKHGGDLVVESEQGVGSTFSVSLPYKMKSQDLDEEEEEENSTLAAEMVAVRAGSMSQKSHESQKSGTRRRKKTPDLASKEPETAERHFTAHSKASDSSLETATMSNTFSAEADAPTILCVDDDPVHLDVVRSLLTQHALKVYAVADGEQAVQFLKMRSVQLMMLDVMMPGMSGQRVLQSVRKFYTSEQLPIIIVSAVCRQETVSEFAKLGANDYIMKPFGRAELLEHVQLHLSKATQARVSRKARELKGIEELASSSTSTALEEQQTAVHVLTKEMERIRSDRDKTVERAQALQKQVEALETELQNKNGTLLSDEQLKFLQASYARQKVLHQHHEGMAAQIQRLELLQKSQHKLLSARTEQDLDGLLQIASSGPGRGPGSQAPLADPKLLQIRKVEDNVGYYLTSIDQLATRLPASSKEELQRIAYQLRAETNKLLMEMGLKCHELASADSMLQHQWLQLQRSVPQLSLGTDPFLASLTSWPPTQTPGAAAYESTV